jgi:hypothetical protein
MLLPVSRSWPRAVAVAPLAIGAIVACLICAVSPAAATTLRHAYRFDPARVHVAAVGTTSALHAEGMAATWEQGQPESRTTC